MNIRIKTASNFNDIDKHTISEVRKEALYIAELYERQSMKKNEPGIKNAVITSHKIKPNIKYISKAYYTKDYISVSIQIWKKG